MKNQRPPWYLYIPPVLIGLTAIAVLLYLILY